DAAAVRGRPRFGGPGGRAERQLPAHHRGPPRPARAAVTARPARRRGTLYHSRAVRPGPSAAIDPRSVRAVQVLALVAALSCRSTGTIADSGDAAGGSVGT